MAQDIQQAGRKPHCVVAACRGPTISFDAMCSRHHNPHLWGRIGHQTKQHSLRCFVDEVHGLAMERLRPRQLRPTMASLILISIMAAQVR